MALKFLQFIGVKTSKYNLHFTRICIEYILIHYINANIYLQNNKELMTLNKVARKGESRLRKSQKYVLKILQPFLNDRKRVT